MIITKTPFRMSFFGGGTDLPEYFRKKRGVCISTTFDKYCYVTIRKLPHFFDYSTELCYSKQEFVNDIDEIKHPAIRNAMKWLEVQNISLNYDADLPARSGLGTSSSFAVGMLNGFYALKGIYANQKKLADDAIYLERILCQESGGWQDQVATAFGGFNRIEFENDSYKVYPIVVSEERKHKLNQSLLLFFTGFTRISSEIHKQNGTTGQEKEPFLDEIYKIADDAQQILVDSRRDLHEFGELLDRTWKMKKCTGANISNDHLDKIYLEAVSAGAVGGKLLGSGGGGFFLFYVEEDKKEAVRKKLDYLLEIPFVFENEGSKVIYYSED